jgi:hypothetical protein
MARSFSATRPKQESVTISLGECIADLVFLHSSGWSYSKSLTIPLLSIGSILGTLCATEFRNGPGILLNNSEALAFHTFLVATFLILEGFGST